MEAYLRISDLQSLMSPTFLGGWRSDLPKLNKSGSGSSCRWSVSPAGESIPQVEAADLTQAETSFTDGREAEAASQQRSSNSQTLSERPSLTAFAGLRGFCPLKTLKMTSELPSVPYGEDPARTYNMRMNTRAHLAPHHTYLVYCHPHRIYVGRLCGRPLFQTKSRRNEELWRHERSGSTGYYGHLGSWVMHGGREPEVREARRDGVRVRDQNVGLDNRMRWIRGIVTERLTPFKSPCAILAL